MIPERPRVLYVTDPEYPANGRRYGDEDVFLTGRLRERFAIVTCHPIDSVAFMDDVDTVVVRNSGPVMHHRAAHDAFVERARQQGTVVYNPLVGTGDMAGKQYLVDWHAAGEPVIPTVDRLSDTDLLPDTDRLVVKPKDGADSIGLQVVDRSDVATVVEGAGWPAGVLIQPLVDLRYEVSFVVVDRTLHYAVHAPDPSQRWALEPYEPTAADRAFVARFIDRNHLTHGIQRVDACRTADGGLLLVELEDLNPYLSLDRIDPATRDTVVEAIGDSILANLRAATPERGARC